MSAPEVQLLGRFVSAFQRGIEREVAAMRTSSETFELTLSGGEDLGSLRYGFELPEASEKLVAGVECSLRTPRGQLNQGTVLSERDVLCHRRQRLCLPVRVGRDIVGPGPMAVETDHDRGDNDAVRPTDQEGGVGRSLVAPNVIQGVLVIFREPAAPPKRDHVAKLRRSDRTDLHRKGA